MKNRVTLAAPETVAFDTQLRIDVTIKANVIFGPGVVIEDEVEIAEFSHLEGCIIRRGARVGPVARLRSGSEVGPGATVGNSAEIRTAILGEGTAADRLSSADNFPVGSRGTTGAKTVLYNNTAR